MPLTTTVRATVGVTLVAIGATDWIVSGTNTVLAAGTVVTGIGVVLRALWILATSFKTLTKDNKKQNKKLTRIEKFLRTENPTYPYGGEDDEEDEKDE